MTPEIQHWMQHIARRFIAAPGNVLEVGALNVNGTVRQYFSDAVSYLGTDMEAGPNVDMVVNGHDLFVKLISDIDFLYDTVIACEVLEHDLDFKETLYNMKSLLNHGGHLIITTPTFGFPLHRYPKDYWRFGEDAYREVFFKDMEILDLRHLDNEYAPGITLAGIARKK
jgi:SAM-dependent methyltransferase